MDDMIVNDLEEKIMDAIFIGMTRKSEVNKEQVIDDMIKTLAGSGYENMVNLFKKREIV